MWQQRRHVDQQPRGSIVIVVIRICFDSLNFNLALRQQTSSPRRVPVLSAVKPDVWSCAEDGTVFLWDAAALEVIFFPLIRVLHRFFFCLIVCICMSVAASNIHRFAVYAKCRCECSGMYCFCLVIFFFYYNLFSQKQTNQ